MGETNTDWLKTARSMRKMTVIQTKKEGKVKTRLNATSDIYGQKICRTFGLTPFVGIACVYVCAIQVWKIQFATNGIFQLLAYMLFMV